MSEDLSFPAARLQDLEKVLGFLDTGCQQAGVPPDAAFAVRLAVEEAFTNVVRHGYGSTPGPVSLTMDSNDTGITITLTDRAPVFDPRRAPKPDLGSDIESRPEGGLGWHLIHRLMDEVHHRAVPGGGNAVTLVKYLGERDED